MRTTKGLSVVALTVALAIALSCFPREARATFVVVNLDSPGEGFNDPTPVAPVGGNPGTTVGQQRLNVFARAGEIWDTILDSPVTIYVRSNFDPLPCNATSGVLGAAGPWVVEADFSGAPFGSTWYAGAEANRIAGTDLEPTEEDLEAYFQSNLGQPGCLSTRFWYYGYDGNEGAAGIDLLAVLLHEFGHGLGFLTLTDDSNGQYYGGLPTIFDRYLYDNVTGKHWIEMTPAERVASAINTGHLVWEGPMVTERAPNFLGFRAHVVASGALTADYVGGQGVFSPPITQAGVSGTAVLVNDGVGLASDGCETPFVNAGAIANNVAVMDRSASCSFAQQAANAEAAGAIAVIIVNNVAGPEPQLRGAAPTVSIPVTSLSQSDGNALKAALGGGVQVTIALDPSHLAGTDDAGRVRMYDPNPLQQGSSVSHYDVSAFPNLLMEPAINPDLTSAVGLTHSLFVDIGWFTGTTGVDPRLASDEGLSIAPNPSSGGGTLRFRLAESRDVEVSVFDVAGRVVAHLSRGVRSAGDQELNWDRRDDRGRRVGPGVYMIRLSSRDEQRSARIVLVD